MLIPQMKLTDVGSDEATVQKYIDDDQWVMQQKFDGTHAMLAFDVTTREISWGNGSHSAAKLKHGALEEILRPSLASLADTKTYLHADRIILDGELLIRTGEYIVWDLLAPNPYAPTDDPYGAFEGRHDALSEFYDIYLQGNPLVRQTPTAWFPSDKQDMWERIKATNVEGAVSKRVGSLYTPGVRSKDWLKHKLCVDADLVVLSAQRKFKENGHTVERGAAGLGAYENGELKPICSASLIGKDLTIEQGDVVVVRYLYREPNGGLVQPRIMRKRWDARTSDGDKRPEDCDFSQFAPYSREVVQL